MQDKIARKRARAIVKRAFKEAKKESWKAYVSNLNRTNSSEVWKAINTIRGKFSQKILLLHVGRRYVSTLNGVLDALAKSLQSIIDEKNYSHRFLHIKTKSKC